MDLTIAPVSTSGVTPDTIHEDVRGNQTPDSYVSASTSNPPLLKYPYELSDALLDLPAASYAMDLFAQSRIQELEEYLRKSDENQERLYIASGYGLLQCVKGFMSYEDKDLLDASNKAQRGKQVANQHRRKRSPISKLQNKISFIKGMTDVERHAEVVYAETLFERALVGIACSKDGSSFIEELFDLYRTMGVYKPLLRYIEIMDADANKRGVGPEDKTIDAHFRSGVYLGAGLSKIILTLLPKKAKTLLRLVGHRGDQQRGLELLMKAGGWKEGKDEPDVTVEEQGVRRMACDLALLGFYLVSSRFTFDTVDISLVSKVLKWNISQYPNSIFFLFCAGRLAFCRSQPGNAIQYYKNSMKTEIQYPNLHDITNWELGIANLALWDIPASLACWKTLHNEGTWSEAIYTYLTAVCVLETGGNDRRHQEDAAKLLSTVQGLRRKVADKSIPLEKFVARKARQFHNRGHLALPGLEIAYFLLAITHAPIAILAYKMLPEVTQLQEKLGNFTTTPHDYEGGTGYWDDLCLAHFLCGVCNRYIAYPDADADLDPQATVTIPKEAAETRAMESFQAVFELGPKIELDHYLVYYAHYEYGRLLVCQGNTSGGKEQFDLVLSGKPLELGTSWRSRRGKYSMQNELLIRTRVARDTLRRVRM
ncbi:hypothetical protein B0H34DRAFT_661565 [Crassisporium funariophilum]|nr:hypothetical protein B0H34DRAFT_661565 [Crassisporium funariophilum]